MSQMGERVWVAPPRLGAQRWTRARLAWLAAAALSLVAALRAGWALWGPLPGASTMAEQSLAADEAQPTIAAAPVASSAPLWIDRPAAVAARRQLLAALAEGGNVFAPDRKPWPLPRTEPEEAPAVTLGAEPPPPPPVRDEGGRLALEAIPLTPISNKLPPALYNQARSMKLEVLFGQQRPSRDQPDLGAVVRVGGAAQLVREGGELTVEDGAWRVLAIDPGKSRLILSRDGYNVELALPRPTAVETAVAAAQPLGARAPVVVERSLEQARSELRAAGLAEWEIEAALRLAQRLDAQAKQPAAGAKGQVAATPGSAPKVTAPPALAELLKLMATGQAPAGAAAAQPGGRDGEQPPKQSEDPPGGAPPS